MLDILEHPKARQDDITTPNREIAIRNRDVKKRTLYTKVWTYQYKYLNKY